MRQRIDARSHDILEQVVNDIKQGGKFSNQIDESVDIEYNTQLMICPRCETDDDNVEEFVYCEPC